MAIVVMVVRFMLVRLLLWIGAHTGRGLGGIEVWAEGSSVGEACMEVQLAVHIMLEVVQG